MKIRPFILIFTLFYSLLIFAQDQAYKDRYSLHSLVPQDTTSVYPWRFCAATTVSCMSMIFTENGQRHLNFLHPQHYPFAEKLEVGCEQRIWLPIQNEKRGRVSLTSKGKNIESARLIITGINKNENVLYIDTLLMQIDSISKSASIDVSLIEVELLDIKVEVEGFKKTESSLSITGVEVVLGKQPIDVFSLRELEQRIEFKADKIIPLHLNTPEGFGKIEVLKTHKIIGIGESVHGNNTIKKMISHLIQYQVSRNQCHLILYEIPLEVSLFYNRYIQDPSFDYDDKAAYGTELVDLIEWIRSYNAGKCEPDKIIFLGNDYIWLRERRASTAITLSNYLVQLNKKLQSKEIDTLSLLLKTEPWTQSISFMKQRRERLEDLLSSTDFMCISHILDLSNSIGYDRTERLALRDSVMFQNTKQLINQFCPPHATVVLYGHSGHLNLISSYPTVIPTRSLGAMMNDYYKDDYYSITTLIGDGSLSLPDKKGGMKSWQLPNILAESVERELSKLEQEVFFTSIPISFDKLTLSRYMGSVFTKQGFYPFNLYRRHNGLLFIRNDKK